jgi:hypothetical protein
MEAATPLHLPQVRTRGDRLVVDALVIDDPCAVRLAQERERAGDDPAKFVVDAVSIGARVLDREQAGAQADFVRAEFEKQAREVETAFAERAQRVGDDLAKQLETVFGADTGHLTKALERHFSDDSAGAVQHRVKAVVDEVTRKGREDLLKQFSSTDGSNPLAEFKQSAVRTMSEASATQERNLRALHAQMAELKQELQGLRDEKQKLVELDVERARGTAKGRTFEEAVHEALDAIATGQGDDCDAVGDLMAAAGKTGDVVVAIEACRGPARGRIVFEAKNSRLTKPKAMEELDRALATRAADYAVLVVPSEEKVPAKMLPLREYNGDKLIVTFDPDDGSRIGLEVAYSLARARVLMSRGGDEGLDTAVLSERLERALGAMDEVRNIKSNLTKASGGIEAAQTLLETLEVRVRGHLAEIETLLAGAAA